MLRRLIDASYDTSRGFEATTAQIEFWLAELRSPEFLHDAVARFPHAAARSTRDAVRMALGSGDVGSALAAEQALEMAQDRVYWEPLRRELEALRHQSRRSV